MSLPLLVDEDTQAMLLVQKLRAAGHDVLTVGEAGCSGRADPDVFAHAIEQQRVLLTRNCNDFRALHGTGIPHAGIIAIYQHAEISKNLSYNDIVGALANLEATDLSLSGQFVVLNQYKY